MELNKEFLKEEIKMVENYFFKICLIFYIEEI